MHLHVTLLQSIYLNIFNGFSWQSNVDITPINYSSFYFSAPHQFILLCHWTKWRNCINHIITTLSLTPLHLHFLFLSLTAEVRYENVISQSSKFPVYLKNEISQGLPSSARLHCSCFFFLDDLFTVFHLYCSCTYSYNFTYQVFFTWHKRWGEAQRPLRAIFYYISNYIQ